MLFKMIITLGWHCSWVSPSLDKNLKVRRTPFNSNMCIMQPLCDTCLYCTWLLWPTPWGSLSDSHGTLSIKRLWAPLGAPIPVVLFWGRSIDPTEFSPNPRNDSCFLLLFLVYNFILFYFFIIFNHWSGDSNPNKRRKMP